MSMTKLYAEYRIRALSKFFPSIQAGDRHGEKNDSILWRHHEERDGRFVQTENHWKFDLSMGEGVRFTVTCVPFNLSSVTKKELDALFLTTLLKLNTSIWENALINLPEGE